MWRQHQVGVNLVGDHEHVMLGADGGHLLQLLRRPNPADRIVGVAQDHGGDGRFGGRRREALQVHGVAPVVEPERVADYFPGCSQHQWLEIGKHRWLEDHSISGFGEEVEQDSNRGADAGTDQRRQSVCVPPVSSHHPGREGVGQCLRPLLISEPAFGRPRLDRLDDDRRQWKVRLGQPKRKQFGAVGKVASVGRRRSGERRAQTGHGQVWRAQPRNFPTRSTAATAVSTGSKAKHTRKNPGSPLRQAEPGVRFTFASSRMRCHRASSAAQV